nr:retrovirus-related Pol polyprotein from transposon TNT 1-94 [Tanacetum cinerariifolium]
MRRGTVWDKERTKVIPYYHGVGVIPITSVSRPHLKSNPHGDRVMHNNSRGKKLLNAKTLNVKSVSAMCDKCVLIDKHDMGVLKSVAKPLKETVASESNKKPRNFTRKLYERVSKTCSWWYPKFTPSGYIWYLKGTPSLGLWYPKCLGFNLKGYSDSDYSAKKQQSVTMSSAEAKYVVDVGCCTNILRRKSQLSDYNIHYKMVPIFNDNASAIAISNNSVLHSRTKHIDIRYHFIRDHILKGDIKLNFIPTEYQLADIFTKPLDEPTFIRLKAELGMLNIN